MLIHNSRGSASVDQREKVSTVKPSYVSSPNGLLLKDTSIQEYYFIARKKKKHALMQQFASSPAALFSVTKDQGSAHGVK